MYLLRKTMIDDYASFETARLLKEAGFDWPCEKWFELKDGTPIEWGVDAGCNWNVSKDDYSRPTLSLAAKWLRVEKNIHVNVQRNCNNWGFSLVNLNPVYMIGRIISIFSTYEEAMEAGLKEALEWTYKVKNEKENTEQH